MPPRKLTQINALAVALALIVSIPGQNAWSAVAGAARGGAVAAGFGGMTGAAGAARVTLSAASLSPAVLTPSLGGAPSLSLAPSPDAAPAASPAPAAGRAAAPLAPAAADAPRLIAPSAAAGEAAAAPAAEAALSAGAQIRSLAPDEYQVVREDEQAEGRWAARAVALFDGMLARPRPLAVDGAESGDRLPRLERRDPSAQGPHVFVAVTLKDPGSPEGLNAAIRKLNAEHGFRLDIGGPIVMAPGVVILRGAVPAERLETMSQAEEVVAVDPLIVRRFAASAPLPETVFRSFVRKQAEKNPATGVLTTMPLHAFAVPMLVFPVFAGLVMVFPPALAFLKPVLLVGGGAALASFSILAPLFRWLPASLRAAASYGAVVVGGSLLAAYGTPFVGLWVAVNGLLGMVAARRSYLRLAQSPDQVLTDKIVNAAEAALHVNLVGGQLLLLAFSSFLGGWMLPAALGLATLLTLFALSRVSEAPEPGLTPATPPSAPNDGPEQRPRTLTFRAAKKAPAAKPVNKSEPFVPATVKIAKLEKLVASDPEAALKQAADYLVRETDKRPEVRIAAVRALQALPAEKALPVFIEYLGAAAKNGVQVSKQTALDKWWYYQWEILRGIAKDAPKLSPASEELLGALKAAYKDWNPSVRLMAGHALRAFGQDPGPEVDPQPAPQLREESAPGDSAGSLTPGMPHRVAPRNGPDNGGSKAWKWIVGIALAGAIAWGIGGLMNAPSTAPQPGANRPAVTQTVPGTHPRAVQPQARPQQAQPAAADTAQQQKQPTAAEAIAEALKTKTPEQVSLEELHRIAQAAERSAAAAEEANRAAAEARAKSGGFSFFSLLLAFGPIILMIWLFTRMFKGGGMGGGAGGIGGVAQAKTNAEKPNIRFHDVAGIDESMVEVEEIVDYLRNPNKYVKIGARVPKGVLLEGPPGTGKTLLAKALAGETDANFLSMSGSDFVQMFVGVGAARVRDLFEQAKKVRPAVIFIDEIDAVGKQRGSGGINSNDEREQTINALLAAMDGFTDSTGIIVVAATNRADMLDAALTRPGRFDRKIHVGLPEQAGREAILALHARKVRLGPDADLKYIARRTTGLSGAFLENVVIEAARLAARRGADEVGMVDLDEGVDRATIGARRTLKLSDKLKLRIARHESGHVLANLLNEDPELRQPTNKVTIVPHGTGALGFAEIGGQEGDTYLYTKRELEARLDHAMGGLVAEKLYYGEWSTGPGSDLDYATRIARTMVQNLGMDEALGFPQTAPNPQDPFGRSPFGDAILTQVHEASKKIISASYERVLKRFNANRHRLDAMSAALMEKETLIDSEIQRFAYGELPPAAPEAPKDGGTQTPGDSKK